MNLSVVGQERKRDHGPLRDLNLQLNNNSQVVQIEASETDDPPVKGESQLAIKDKPARARPRFDPTREQVVAQRIADKKKIVVQPPREHRRDPSTEGPPDREEERRMKRRPPLPPPATSTRQASAGHTPLAFAKATSTKDWICIRVIICPK